MQASAASNERRRPLIWSRALKIVAAAMSHPQGLGTRRPQDCTSPVRWTSSFAIPGAGSASSNAAVSKRREPAAALVPIFEDAERRGAHGNEGGNEDGFGH